jgi:predicted dehydrogenase
MTRLGFLGTGWIGRNRMEAMLATGKARAVGICDPDPDNGREAEALAPDAVSVGSLEGLLALGLDGLVIATPSALHAEQCVAALDAGVSVFCQKPLGRNAREVSAVLDAARNADRLLGVDLSYRHTSAMQAIRDRVRAGELGKIFAADLVFHNAYGPDKPWVRDPELAGGGALIDLGCHLLDLARLFMGKLEPARVHADLFASGSPLDRKRSVVEDLALAQVSLTDGRAIRLACSWWLPAGVDAVIELSFLGEGRALKVRNVNGSFYDFEALLVEGRQARRIAAPPDAWGGRALIAWTQRLGAGGGFDPDVCDLAEVAGLIDAIYGRQP